MNPTDLSKPVSSGRPATAREAAAFNGHTSYSPAEAFEAGYTRIQDGE
jgi:hypothetical protein